MKLDEIQLRLKSAELAKQPFTGLERRTMRPAEFYLIILFILENKSVRMTHSSKLDGGRGSFP